MKIYVASDHAGFELKTYLLNHFRDITWVDLGPASADRVDYPDFADKVARALKDEPQAMGLLICGSGQGMAIRANRYRHIRAALCWNEQIAELARSHNDANVLCLGARYLEPETAGNILTRFLQTPFEGERHVGRVEKLSREC